MDKKKNVSLRGSLPDAETPDKIYLIKSTSELRATYQVRLLLYRAVNEQKVLVLALPKDCHIHPDLAQLMSQHANNIILDLR